MELILSFGLFLYAIFGSSNSHPTTILCANINSYATKSPVETSFKHTDGQQLSNREGRKLNHWERIRNSDKKHEIGIIQQKIIYHSEFNVHEDNLEFISKDLNEHINVAGLDLELDFTTAAVIVVNNARDRVIWKRIPQRDKLNAERNHEHKKHVLQLFDHKHADGVHNSPHPFNWENWDFYGSINNHNGNHFYTPDHEKWLHSTDYKNQKNYTESTSNKNFSAAQSQINHSRSDEYINPPNCGLSVGQKLWNVNRATLDQFPWIVRIAYRNKTTNRIDYRCSGSMISFDAILTAAHCVKNLVQDLVISHVLVGDNGLIYNRYRINEIIAHPHYDKPKYANDIALLRINSTVSDKLPTVCLPLNNPMKDEFIEKYGIFAGWNINNAAEEVVENNSVQYLKLSIVNATTCAKAYAKFSENARDPIIIRPTQLCAISVENQDVCQGDSGGPFMDDGTKGRYTVLGVVAFGLIQPTANNISCGALNFPSVYTRVSAYVRWIISEIRRENNKNI